MQDETEIRWQQRFSRFRKVSKNLSKAIEIINSKNVKENLAKIEKDEIVKVLEDGLIRRFE